MPPIGSRRQRQCHRRVVSHVAVIGVVDVVAVGYAEAPKAQRVRSRANKGHGAVARDAPLGYIYGEQPSWLKSGRRPPSGIHPPRGSS